MQLNFLTNPAHMFYWFVIIEIRLTKTLVLLFLPTYYFYTCEITACWNYIIAYTIKNDLALHVEEEIKYFLG